MVFNWYNTHQQHLQAEFSGEVLIHSFAGINTVLLFILFLLFFRNFPSDDEPVRSDKKRDFDIFEVSS